MGGLARVRHVGAGTKQSSWFGGIEAGAQAQTQSFPGNKSAGDMVDVHDCRVLDMDLLCPTSLGFVQMSVLQRRFLRTNCVSGRWSVSPY